MELLGYISLAFVAVQFGVQPFINNYCWSFRPEGVDTNNSLLVIAQELAKVLMIVVWFTCTRQWTQVLKANDWSLSSALSVAFWPAASYSVQNVMAFSAYLLLDPLLFNLLNQSKLLFAAFFLYLILGRRQTSRKLTALSILFFVSSALSLDHIISKKCEADSSFENASADAKSNVSAIFGTVIETLRTIDFSSVHANNWGLTAAGIAALCSGLGGTLVQRALQDKGRNSLLFTMELSIISVALLMTRLLVDAFILHQFDGYQLYKLGIGASVGHWMTLVPSLTNAIGGIYVGFVTQFAGVIGKSYSIIVGILLSAVIRWLQSDDSLSPVVVTAVPLVMLSLWLNMGPKAKVTETKKKKLE